MLPFPIQIRFGPTQLHRDKGHLMIKPVRHLFPLPEASQTSYDLKSANLADSLEPHSHPSTPHTLPLCSFSSLPHWLEFYKLAPLFQWMSCSLTQSPRQFVPTILITARDPVPQFFPTLYHHCAVANWELEAIYQYKGFSRQGNIR